VQGLLSGFGVKLAHADDHAEVAGVAVWINFPGDPVQVDSVSFVARNMFMQVLHKTYAGTGTVCTGVAASIPGTVVAEVRAGQARWGYQINIGHPCGIIPVEAEVENGVVRRAAFARTARRIMEGYVFIA